MHVRKGKSNSKNNLDKANNNKKKNNKRKKKRNFETKYNGAIT